MSLNIDIETGIENCGGMKDFYIEILDTYEEEGLKDELQRNYDDKNWELYTINVHSLKGTMRLIGAIDAGELAEKLQFAGEAGDTATIDSFHNQLIEMMEESIKLIREQL